MGLAPYGEPIYADLILEKLLDLKADGSFRLDMSYFAYTHQDVMTSTKFDELFGGPPRKAESPITQREMDLAASIQAVTEEIMLRIARHVHELTGMKNLVPGGRRRAELRRQRQLLREGPFETSGSSPPPATPAARSARRCSSGTSCSTTSASRQGQRPAEGLAARAGATRTTRSRRSSTRTGAAYRVYESEDALCDAVAELIAAEQGGRALRRAHGVRPARARRPLDPRRRALAQDAVDDEPEDQVPRVVPAVRAGGAARATSTSSSRCARTRTARTCCWSRRCARRSALADRVGAARSGLDKLNAGALGHSRRSRTSTTRRACRRSTPSATRASTGS